MGGEKKDFKATNELGKNTQAERGKERAEDLGADVNMIN